MSSGTFARFLFVGAINTALGYGTILLLHYRFGADPVLANACGYGVGLLASYLLNRRFTFRSGREHRRALPWFLVIAGACYLMNLAVLQLSIEVLSLPVALSQALAMLTYTVTFYLANRYGVFRPQRA